jgi:hypothetical protein
MSMRTIFTGYLLFVLAGLVYCVWVAVLQR